MDELGDYVCAGAGGDFVLPRTRSYQPLHVDLQAQALPQPPVVTANVCLQPLTKENGPTRVIPGTQLGAAGAGAGGDLAKAVGPTSLGLAALHALPTASRCLTWAASVTCEAP